MEDNSTISNFANDEEFELMIIKDLHQIIEVIADRYPEDRYPYIVAFRFTCQEVLKMDEEELDNIESKWRYNFEKEMKENFLRIDRMKEQICEFCDANYFITKLIKRKLIFFSIIDPTMTNEILCEFSDWYIQTSEARGITNRYKLFYEKLTGIIPCEEEFIRYLISKPIVYFDAESLKEYLSEYMDNEVNQTYDLPKNKKYIKQEVIDITPQQTLSIEKKTNDVEEQIKINLDSNYESLFERFKETYLIGLKVSTSLIDISKYYDLFDKELKLLLSFAGFKSIKTRLDTVREIKIKFLMSLGNAEQFIGLDRNGVYEHPKPSTFVQTKKGIEGLVQRVEELDTNLKEPLIVARANKRVYEDIVTLLDREEEMIVIELRNGKSLDYSPLNDKKDNGNPTTSATVEKGVSLSHREIATLCYLMGLKDLTYPQAEELALFHGQKSRTSGKRLKEQYWKVIEKEEGMNHKYNAEIYTHSNSYQSILKIIPLLEKEECIKLAEEYLKKSQPYKDVKSKEY